MAHIKIDPIEHLPQIMRELKKGVLLTAKNLGKVNTMTIAWGQIGIEWNKMIFTAFVRKSRYTHDMIVGSGEFTVNIGLDDGIAEILDYCGTLSGRDVDKVKDLNLTIVEGIKVSTPGFKELPLTLECRLIYEQKQDFQLIPQPIRKKYYNRSFDTTRINDEDIHTMFFGEILGAHIIQ